MSRLVPFIKRMRRRLLYVFANRKTAQSKSFDSITWLVNHGINIQGNTIKLNGLPIIRKHPFSTIRIGDNVILTSSSETNPAGINHPVILATYSDNSEIIIEDNVGMSGASINCVSKVIIKQGVMLGANVNVWDTDFHPVNSADRATQKSILDAQSAPIIIEKNVWVGANSTILKGVTIGENTVVSTMSLVNKDLPANSLCAGIPARKIKDL